tara:strand:- start:99 stop:314 length:216 start_codon:yes stop_codon:yes gene_type:complete
MSIYAIGFGVMMLLIQAYSASQKDIKKKVSLVSAILMSVFWFITAPLYIVAKTHKGGVSNAIKKLFNLPIA